METNHPITETSAKSRGRASEQFRLEHVEIKEHLAHLEKITEKLADQTLPEKKRIIHEVVHFLSTHLLAHAEWEEKVLYEAIDRTVPSSQYLWTQTMRYDHRIIERWVHLLAKEAEKKEPDAAKFIRHCDRLLGLVQAHFEKEEEVLLPILDGAMTREDFDREIMGKSPH